MKKNAFKKYYIFSSKFITEKNSSTIRSNVF